MPFKYSLDSCALGLGLGTAPRHNSLGFSRVCYSGLSVADVCPHSHQDLPSTSDNTALPDTTTRASLGTRTRSSRAASRHLGRSVSSLFDIEYRTYGSARDNLADNST